MEPKLITQTERLARKIGCAACAKSTTIDLQKNLKEPIMTEQQDTTQFPSRWEMLKNLVIAAKDAVASGLEVRTPEDTEKALKICDTCPKLVIDDGNARCGVCGCFLGGNGKLGKTSLTAWHCPLGKW